MISARAFVKSSRARTEPCGYSKIETVGVY